MRDNSCPLSWEHPWWWSAVLSMRALRRVWLQQYYHHLQAKNLLPKEQHLALQKARRRQATEEFKQAYARRAGVEGTVSQGTRTFGLCRSRYIGLAKTHLQHVCTTVAINLIRLADWFDETPRAQTRRSRFATLAVAA